VESVKTDVRIIAATNKKLEDLVTGGKFREDLYYRINVIRLDLPSLRERKEDIPLLVDRFIGTFNTLQNKKIAGLTDEALACLVSYNYPGNIRELKNIIERAFVLCKSEMIQREHLPELVWKTDAEEYSRHSDMVSFKDMEAIFLTNALRRNNWNRAKTARELGIHKSTLFRKIKSLGLQLPKAK
jgi:transcriptional regulator with PAS, ATPase and Fis domain